MGAGRVVHHLAQIRFDRRIVHEAPVAIDVFHELQVMRQIGAAAWQGAGPAIAATAATRPTAATIAVKTPRSVQVREAAVRSQRNPIAESTVDTMSVAAGEMVSPVQSVKYAPKIVEGGECDERGRDRLRHRQGRRSDRACCATEDTAFSFKDEEEGSIFSAWTRRHFLVGSPSRADSHPCWPSARPIAAQALPEKVRGVQILVFDTFGTVVDWRSAVIAEGEKLGKEKGLKVDWAAFADAWRGGYGPSMNRVRTGELPWTKLDVLHRMTLDGLIEKFKITGLTEDEKKHFNKVWHRLHGWPDAVSGLTRLKKRFVISPLSNGNVSLLTDMAKFAGLPWDTVLSTELVRHYKPDKGDLPDAGRILGSAAVGGR